MGWIKERIEAEKRKHNHHDVDWMQLAEKKIVMQIMEYCWKNNTIPMAELHNIECECGHSLFTHASPDIVEKVGEACSNKFCACKGYRNKIMKSKLRLATTDGGYVNVLKLKPFLERNNEKK